MIRRHATLWKSLPLSLAIIAGGLISFQTAAASDFTVIPLGVYGGSLENNLSSYLLAPTAASMGKQDWVALDAGTLMAGLTVAAGKGSLKGLLDKPGDPALQPAAAMLSQHVKAYLISHAHIDHCAGLVINSPEDTTTETKFKRIYGSSQTVTRMRKNLFNAETWPVFAADSELSAVKFLERYVYVPMTDSKEAPIMGTKMTVRHFPLAHSKDSESSAFLIGCQGKYVLYCGDTGPDSIENKGMLKALWGEMAPLVQKKALVAIFLEASWANARPDNLLFGHLTPKHVMAEMGVLAQAVSALSKAPVTKDALTGVKLVITHLKPLLDSPIDPWGQIQKELTEANSYGLAILRPEQGMKLEL